MMPVLAHVDNRNLFIKHMELVHYVKRMHAEQSSHLSFSEPFDLLNSHAGKQPFKGDCRSMEDVDNCFCRIEIEDRQLNELLSLLLSLSIGW